MLQQERRIDNQFLSVRAFNDCNLSLMLLAYCETPRQSVRFDLSFKTAESFFSRPPPYLNNITQLRIDKSNLVLLTELIT